VHIQSAILLREYLSKEEQHWKRYLNKITTLADNKEFSPAQEAYLQPVSH
jgi:hypothetical protein